MTMSPSGSSRRLAAALLVLAAVAAGRSPALAVEEVDRAAGRAAIERQLDAFKRDDAAGAYEMASPSIRSMFPSQDVFLEMVRRGYKPVYRPRSYAFGQGRDDGEGFEQTLQVQDQDGVDWDAVYSLERQPDGSWRISGCRLVKRPGEAV